MVIIKVTTGTFNPVASGANSFSQSGGNDIWTFTSSGTFSPTAIPATAIPDARLFFI